MNESLSIEKNCWEQLFQVHDPEIGCNIVDLGLIYSLSVSEGVATVSMTLTTPGCPMHESIVAGVQAALTQVNGVSRADVTIVWEPAWKPEMMSPMGRMLINGSQM